MDNVDVKNAKRLISDYCKGRNECNPDCVFFKENYEGFPPCELALRPDEWSDNDEEETF